MKQTALTGPDGTRGFAYTFLVLAILSPLLSPAADAEEKRPNFILCMADDQGWGDVGYYANSIAKTPVLDEMASSGLRFDRFYAASSVCSPTRGSVLTGRNPNRFGCFSWGHSLRPAEVTVAEALRTAGYATAHFGKWHLGSVDARSDVSPGASGFDHWFSSPNFFENDPLMSENGRVVRVNGESSMVTMNAAIQFMRACTAKQQPFLAVVWFGSPHVPHIASEQDRKLYPDQPEELQHYYGEITGIDRSMGILRDELRALEIAQDTLLWYTSDNGPQGPDNRGRPGSAGGLRDRKATLWEGGIRVPAIIEWPQRIAESRITSVPCSTVDIYPTLLDIAGVQVEGQLPLDGSNIRSVIDDKVVQRERPLGFWSFPSRGNGMNSPRILAALQQSLETGEYPDAEPNDAADRRARTADATNLIVERGFVGHAVWIDNRFKLHRLPSGNTGRFKYELYDLDRDAAEAHDIAADFPERVAVMKRQLVAWQASVASSLAGEDYACAQNATAALSSAVDQDLVQHNRRHPESGKWQVRVLKDVPYLGEDREARLDFYLPVNSTPNQAADARRPAVLIIHGGGWHGGDKAAKREQNIGNSLATAGYVCASTNYELASKTDRLADRLREVWPRNLHDCKQAVRFLRKHATKYNIDPDRIGAIGGSAGGHLVAMLAVTDASDGLDPDGLDSEFSCRIQAVIPMYGVHDVLEQTRKRGGLSELNEADRQLCRSASPISYITADDPPALILHGTKDSLVPTTQSRILHDQLREAGVVAELHVIEGAPHSFHLQPQQRDLRPLVIQFLDRCLGSAKK